MYVHAVMLKFAERAEGRGKAENISYIRDQLFDMENSLSYPVKIDMHFDDNLVDDNYDMLIITRHVDRTALLYYRSLSEYNRLIQTVDRVIIKKASLNYED